MNVIERVERWEENIPEADMTARRANERRDISDACDAYNEILDDLKIDPEREVLAEAMMETDQTAVRDLLERMQKTYDARADDPNVIDEVQRRMDFDGVGAQTEAYYDLIRNMTDYKKQLLRKETIEPDEISRLVLVKLQNLSKDMDSQLGIETQARRDLARYVWNKMLDDETRDALGGSLDAFNRMSDTERVDIACKAAGVSHPAMEFLVNANREYGLAFAFKMLDFAPMLNLLHTFLTGEVSHFSVSMSVFLLRTAFMQVFPIAKYLTILVNHYKANRNKDPALAKIEKADKAGRHWYEYVDDNVDWLNQKRDELKRAGGRLQHEAEAAARLASGNVNSFEYLFGTDASTFGMLATMTGWGIDIATLQIVPRIMRAVMPKLYEIIVSKNNRKFMIAAGIAMLISVPAMYVYAPMFINMYTTQAIWLQDMLLAKIPTFGWDIGGEGAVQLGGALENSARLIADNITYKPWLWADSFANLRADIPGLVREASKGALQMAGGTTAGLVTFIPTYTTRLAIPWIFEYFVKPQMRVMVTCALTYTSLAGFNLITSGTGVREAALKRIYQWKQKNDIRGTIGDMLVYAPAALESILALAFMYTLNMPQMQRLVRCAIGPGSSAEECNAITNMWRDEYKNQGEPPIGASDKVTDTKHVVVSGDNAKVTISSQKGNDLGQEYTNPPVDKNFSNALPDDAKRMVDAQLVANQGWDAPDLDS